MRAFGCEGRGQGEGLRGAGGQRRHLGHPVPEIRVIDIGASFRVAVQVQPQPRPGRRAAGARVADGDGELDRLPDRRLLGRQRHAVDHQVQGLRWADGDRPRPEDVVRLIALVDVAAVVNVAVDVVRSLLIRGEAIREHRQVNRSAGLDIGDFDAGEFRACGAFWPGDCPCRGPGSSSDIAERCPHSPGARCSGYTRWRPGRPGPR